MKIGFISDTHLTHLNVGYKKFYEKLKSDIKGLDVLVHSGDGTNSKSKEINISEMERFLNWYSELDVNNKIYVPGNHDTSAESYPNLVKTLFKEKGVRLLSNSGVEILGKNFYGVPQTPFFCNWAFNLDDFKLEKLWNTIPENVEILVTHGPPKNILDICGDGNVGDKYFEKFIEKNNSIKIVSFGHIHESYGTLYKYNKTFINSSLVNESYIPVNPIQIIEI